MGTREKAEGARETRKVSRKVHFCIWCCDHWALFFWDLMESPQNCQPAGWETEISSTGPLSHWVSAAHVFPLFQAETQALGWKAWAVWEKQQSPAELESCQNCSWDWTLGGSRECDAGTRGCLFSRLMSVQKISHTHVPPHPAPQDLKGLYFLKKKWKKKRLLPQQSSTPSSYTHCPNYTQPWWFPRTLRSSYMMFLFPGNGIPSLLAALPLTP